MSSSSSARPSPGLLVGAATVSLALLAAGWLMNEGPSGASHEQGGRVPVRGASAVGIVSPALAREGAEVAHAEAHYRFELEESTELHLAGGLESDNATRSIGGRLACQVVDERQGEQLLALSIVEGRMACTDGSGAEEVSALVGSCSLRRGSDGELLGFRFDGELDGDTKDVLRVLAFALRARLPEGAHERGGWSFEERDLTGPYIARYAWEGPASEGLRTLTTRKDRSPFRAIDSSLGDCVAASTVVLPVIGPSRAIPSGRAVWPQSVRSKETLCATIHEVEGRIAVELDLTLRLIGQGPLGHHGAARWEGEWASIDGAEDLDDIDPEEPAFRAQELEELSAELARLSGAPSLEPIARLGLLEQLAAQLAEDPSLLDDVLAELQRGDLPEDSASLLGAALAAAGTADAAAVLSAVAQDPLLPSSRRLVGVMALGAFDSGLQAPRATLLALVEDPASERSLRGTAMLAIGSMARNDGARSGKGREAEGDAMALLLAQEDTARRRNQLPSWFEALANANTAEAFAALAPYLTSLAPRRRSAAVVALGRMTVPGALEALVDRSCRERLESVRLEAARALARREEPEATEATRARLRSEASESIRAGIVRSLLRRASTDTDAAALLRHVALADPCDRVRRLAAAVDEGGVR